MTKMDQVQAATRDDDADWWRGGVIYQIYPRSFQDSNGDGIGDLQGIVERLPYVASLGVDAIWISPFFTSPMRDFGYDVSDYRDVDPMFGTLADFDALVARAHELGVRVMIDLVLSHTSDQHPWFQESRASRTGPKHDWYVWADAKPDGSPPNNWLSIFGGSAWQWDAERMQYYLHNFLVSQPDLNFHNPDVQNALLDVTRFWLERGVDGFRLDTVNFYVHDKQLRDNPPLPESERNDKTAPSVNPYNFQDHLFDKTQPENIGFLKRFRALLDEYPDKAAVGEVGEGQRGMEVQAEYTKGDDRLHMCYDFAFLSNEFPTSAHVAGIVEKLNQVASDGWACWAFSNHDVMRHASRWGLKRDQQKLYAALLLTLKGSVCLYQGEELGLTEADVAYEDLQDPYGKEFWPKFKGRDGARTPFPWNGDSPNAGFSSGKTWLPVAPEHVQQSANSQEHEPDSILNFYRAMLLFRKRHSVLLKGDIEVMSDTAQSLSFVRRHNGQQVLCIFNFAERPMPVQWPDGSWEIDEHAPFDFDETDAGVTLPPYHALFAVRAGDNI